jgi:hypothetical protein
LRLLSSPQFLKRSIVSKLLKTRQQEACEPQQDELGHLSRVWQNQPVLLAVSLRHWATTSPETRLKTINKMFTILLLDNSSYRALDAANANL